MTADYVIIIPPLRCQKLNPLTFNPHPPIFKHQKKHLLYNSFFSFLNATIFFDNSFLFHSQRRQSSSQELIMYRRGIYLRLLIISSTFSCGGNDQEDPHWIFGPAVPLACNQMAMLIFSHGPKGTNGLRVSRPSKYPARVPEIQFQQLRPPAIPSAFSPNTFYRELRCCRDAVCARLLHRNGDINSEKYLGTCGCIVKCHCTLIFTLDKTSFEGLTIFNTLKKPFQLFSIMIN